MYWDSRATQSVLLLSRPAMPPCHGQPVGNGATPSARPPQAPCSPISPRQAGSALCGSMMRGMLSLCRFQIPPPQLGPLIDGPSPLDSRVALQRSTFVRL